MAIFIIIIFSNVENLQKHFMFKSFKIIFFAFDQILPIFLKKKANL